MNGMTPEDRALLDLARGGHEPSATDRERVRVALVGRIGIGAGLGSAGMLKASAAVALTKGLVVVALVGAVGGAALVATRAAPPSPATTASAGDRHESTAPGRFDGVFARAAMPSVGADPVRPTAMGPVAATRAAPPAAASSAQTPPGPSAWVRTAIASGAPTAQPHLARPGEGSAAAGALATTSAAGRLVAETRLLRSGIEALHAGDPGRALTLFDEHARAFPDGSLNEERDAERVLALCDLYRREDAHAAAAAFLRTYARSPLATRIRGSCAGPTNP